MLGSVLLLKKLAVGSEIELLKAVTTRKLIKKMGCE